MHLSRAEFDILDEAKLLAFVGRSIAEGHHLDYKSQLSGPPSPSGLAIAALSPPAKEEFLKDVSSFANANGGLILIGVDEPSEGTSAVDQTPGVADGEALAKALENVAASGLEPRILGLQVRPIRLAASGRSVVAIFIPPSAGKPHVFRAGRNLGAFIRHRETCQPMTAFELRESVLSSLSAEARASQYLETQKNRILAHYASDDGTPESTLVLFQAMPLVKPEQPLEVLTDSVRAALMFDDRSLAPLGLVSLQCMNKPRATLEGLSGRGAGLDARWVIEVHRSGCISVAWIPPRQDDSKAECRLGPEFQEMGILFVALVQRVLGALAFQSPYLVKARIFNAENLQLLPSAPYYQVNRAFGRTVLAFDDQLVSAPEGLGEIAETWWRTLHNAFGLDGPPLP